jgi:hypothetical protein
MATTSGPTVPAQMIDECGAIGEMSVGRGKGRNLRKPAPVVLCPPQIPHDPSYLGGKLSTSHLSCHGQHVHHTMAVHSACG